MTMDRRRFVGTVAGAALAPLALADAATEPRATDDLGAAMIREAKLDRKSTRLNSSHGKLSRMPSSA